MPRCGLSYFRPMPIFGDAMLEQSGAFGVKRWLFLCHIPQPLLVRTHRFCMPDPVLDALLHHERFLITTHVRPDGDAIGSQLALGMVLRKMGKEVTMINSDPVPDNLVWLSGIEEVQTFDKSLAQLKQIDNAEVIVVVDTNGLERIGKMARPVKGSNALKLLIDHHTEPETWFDHTYARDTASSTGELIYELIAAHDADLIDEDIATALYAAILTDTGSFRYSSVTPAVHHIVADLMERGNLEPETLYSALYETKSPEGLRLLGKVLDTLTLARRKHPGQKNSLDALCKRYEIDNSQRQLHGALLDAEILADVYLAMTGGQGSLFASDSDAGEQTVAAKPLDRDHLKLPVIQATTEELNAHQERLEAIDKASGGACLWLSGTTEETVN